MTPPPSVAYVVGLLAALAAPAAAQPVTLLDKVRAAPTQWMADFEAAAPQGVRTFIAPSVPLSPTSTASGAERGVRGAVQADWQVRARRIPEHTCQPIALEHMESYAAATSMSWPGGVRLAL